MRDHRDRPPPSRLEDVRQPDAGGDHVLRRADQSTVSREPLDQRFWRSDPACHLLEDARHMAKFEPLAERAALVHRAEQPSPGDAASLKPDAHQPRGVAGDVDRLAPALGVGLGTAHEKGPVAGHFDKQVTDLQRRELGAAQHCVIGNGEQGTVAVVDERVLGSRRNVVGRARRY